MRDMFTLPNMAKTVHFDHIKHYYWFNSPQLTGYNHYVPHLFMLVRRTTVPKGGVPDLYLPHDRHRFKESEPIATLDGGVAGDEMGTQKATGRCDHHGRTWLTNYGLAGEFIRPSSGFRNIITADGSSEFPAEAGRYHLYVANNCPCMAIQCTSCQLTGH